MKIEFRISLFVLVLAVLSACNDDDPKKEVVVGSEGFFVVNEGTFGAGNASISFYDRTDGNVSNDIFQTTNGIPLGDQAQSMTVHEGKGYIVVQSSGKVEVIDATTYEQLATITDGIESPRYFVGASATKGYVTDWGADGVSGTVKVIDLVANEVIKTISVGSGPNQMQASGSRMYVANGGGFGSDNTVAVLNMETDELIEKVEVSNNPNSIQVDSDGDLWVAASGLTIYDADFNIDVENSIPGELVEISADGEELSRISFSGIGGPSKLTVNDTRTALFYLYSGQIYNFSTSDSSLPTNPLNDDFYYGLSWDPVGKVLIGCKAPDFTSAGVIEFLDLSGNVQSSNSVGIAPNGVVFR